MKSKTSSEPGTIKGGQVFLFSRKIKNDGKIVSSGPGAKTFITTDNYKGKGTIESHSEVFEQEGFLRKHLISILLGVITTVMSGLLLYYIFGIK